MRAPHLAQFKNRPDFCFTDFFLKDLRQRFPEAHVHEFRDAGHYVVEDAGDEILELVERFLDGH